MPARGSRISTATSVWSISSWMPWPSRARRTFHPEQAIAALQAGKHLYLAKPMAVDVAGCLAIEQAVRAAGPSRHVLVDFQTRRDPLFREAAARVHRGDIGPAVLGHVYYHAGRLKPQAPEGTATARLRNWVFDQALSGDIIVEQNIHVIDVANWYLQAHPVKAQGTGGRKARVDVGDCRDHYVVTFTYPDGVLVDFSSTQFCKGFDDLRIRVYGANGTVDSAYDGDVKLTGDAPWAGGNTKGLYTSGAVGNIQDFHAAVTGGQSLRRHARTEPAKQPDRHSRPAGRDVGARGHVGRDDEGRLSRSTRSCSCQRMGRRRPRDQPRGTEWHGRGAVSCRDGSCLDYHKVLGPGVANRFERDGTIERHQRAGVRRGEAEQVDVGELSVSGRQIEQPGVANGDVVRPEHMMTAGPEHGQAPRDLLRTFGDRRIRGIRQDAYHARSR